MAQVPQNHPELEAAHRCAERGDFDQAHHHLEIAAMQGVPPNRIGRENLWIGSLQRSHFKARAERMGFAVALPFLSYLILSIAEPPSYGTALWVFLAFLAVPLLTGFAISRALTGFARGPLFLRGFLIAGSAMAFYSVFNLVLVRNRIVERVDPVPVIEVGAAVTAIYSIAAGLVSGLVSAALAREVSS